MKLLTMNICVVLFATGHANAATSQSCPQREAAFVEENVQNMESWDRFHAFYLKHKSCDTDALRYAFTQQIAHLTGTDRGLPELSRTLMKDRQFKFVVMNHLKSEAVTSKDRDQILKAIETCQPRQTKLCREVRKMVTTH